MAARYDDTIDQGSTWRRDYTARDKTGALVDLTGCTAAMQLRLLHSSPDPPLLSLSSGNGIETDGPAGKVSVVASAAQTAALPGSKRVVYDLELTFPGGDVLRLVEGSIWVSPEVTR